MLILGLATGHTAVNGHLQSYANRGLKRASAGHALPCLDQPAGRTPEEGPQVPQVSHRYVNETLQHQSHQLRAKEMPNELSAFRKNKHPSFSTCAVLGQRVTQQKLTKTS